MEISKESRKFDLVIWGATGFTGQLVVEYLSRQYGIDGKLKWAIAGRNKDKLNSVARKLAIDRIPVIIADSLDRESLDKMVSSSRVICSTVGPYAKYGTPLVESCVANRTDYCDLTGEVQWIRKMIDTYHEKAKANGVRIVHCCGFDSIPSDMGVFFLQEKAMTRRGEYCKQVKCRVRAMKGGFSGGTLASLNNVMDEVKANPEIGKVLRDPYGLNPRGERKGPDGRDLSKVQYDEDLKGWLSPFVMAPINTKVVRRSHALMGFPYGQGFQYDEAMLMGGGVSGRLKANAALASIALLMGGGQVPGIKQIISRFLPDPGEGPSSKQRESGFFKMLLYGIFKDGSSIQVKVKGDRDPGYGSTSKMLGESAVCLAKDTESIPRMTGVLTPSTAMGEALLTRLQTNAGLSFELME